MSDKPHRVAVLKGGPSAEREVSLRSGTAAAEALREAGYDVSEVIVEDASFVVPDGTDLAFLALHGTFGEDGQIQEILEERGIPYTGASADVSRITIDKEKTKAKFRECGVPTPEGQLVRRLEEVTLSLPVFTIKPNAQGSSVGTRPVTTREELASALANALKFDSAALVERFIQGRELTVGVLGNQVLPIVEIHPLDGFYDYTNKYTKGRTEYFCPARLSEDITVLIQNHALRAHRAIGHPVYSRIDFLLEKDAPYCLEINTIPGMTATSLLPKAAAAVGIDFPQLCRRIVELSWAARQAERTA